MDMDKKTVISMLKQTNFTFLITLLFFFVSPK